MQIDNYRTNMARNVYKTVEHCHNYARYGKNRNGNHRLLPLLVTGPSKFAYRNILGTYFLIAKGNSHFVISTEMYSILTRTVLTAIIITITAT